MGAGTSPMVAASSTTTFAMARSAASRNASCLTSVTRRSQPLPKVGQVFSVFSQAIRASQSLPISSVGSAFLTAARVRGRGRRARAIPPPRPRVRKSRRPVAMRPWACGLPPKPNTKSKERKTLKGPRKDPWRHIDATLSRVSNTDVAVRAQAAASLGTGVLRNRPRARSFR